MLHAFIVAQAVSLAIDPAKSKAMFSVPHVFVERVTGTVPISGGTVAVSPESPIPASISAELDPSKISSGDRDRASTCYILHALRGRVATSIRQTASVRRQFHRVAQQRIGRNKVLFHRS